jgi:hypothetical protein
MGASLLVVSKYINFYWYVCVWRGCAVCFAGGAIVGIAWANWDTKTGKSVVRFLHTKRLNPFTQNRHDDEVQFTQVCIEPAIEIQSTGENQFQGKFIVHHQRANVMNVRMNVRSVSYPCRR